MGETGKKALLIGFCVMMILITAYAVKRIERLHATKEEKGYNYDSKDVRFQNVA